MFESSTIIERPRSRSACRASPHPPRSSASSFFPTSATTNPPSRTYDHACAMRYACMLDRLGSDHSPCAGRPGFSASFSKCGMTTAPSNEPGTRDGAVSTCTSRSPLTSSRALASTDPSRRTFPLRDGTARSSARQCRQAWRTQRLTEAGFVRWGALFFFFPDAGGVIEWLTAFLDIDPVLHALDQAPIGEEDLSPEELWEI